MFKDGDKIQLKDVLSRGMIKLWDQYTEGVYVTDARGTCLYINPLQKKHDGFQGVDVIGKSTRQLYWSDHGVLPSQRSILTRKSVTETSLKYNSKTNQIIEARVHCVPLFNKEEIAGSIVFCIGRRLPSKAVTQVRKEPPKANELHSFNHIIGEENSFKKVIKSCRHVAPSDSPVLIYGETGTGKELFAQAIHNESPRRLKPFVPVNCSAIPEQLLEGVLFGTTKGAFTNSVDKKGLLESADGGSVFLDEMNSMPLSLQPKLLRFLQEHKVRRVGGEHEIPVDVRVISAFNIHPLEAVAGNVIRQDIYYRLAVFFVEIPPLRRRKLDIPALCHHFLFKWGKGDIHISDDIFNRFFQYDWPGNVRELENIVEGAVSLLDEDDRVLSLKDLPEYFNKPQIPSTASPTEGDVSPALFQGLEYLKQIVENQGRILTRPTENRATLPGGAEDVRPEELALVRALFSFFKEHKAAGSAATLNEIVECVTQETIDSALARSRGNITQAARRLGMSQQRLSYRLKKMRETAE